VKKIAVSSRTWGETIMHIMQIFPDATIVNAEELVNKLRRIKSAEEIEQMTTACHLVDDVLAQVEGRVNIGVTELDQEGRQLTLIFKNFILINCYFPNGGGEAHRLEYKLAYFDAFLKFLKKLEKTNKNIIFCGDVNIAHTEIDIARPKENAKSIGFLPQERVKVDAFIENNYVDVFRHLNPDKVTYTWWDQKSRARDRNIGWRIDYFFVHKDFIQSVDNLLIRDNVLGSDHCPISCKIKL
jgi:exodeoxyribonuclease-3